MIVLFTFCSPAADTDVVIVYRASIRDAQSRVPDSRLSRHSGKVHEQLDPSYVSTRFQQVRGERVPQGMRRYWLLDAAAPLRSRAMLHASLIAQGVIERPGMSPGKSQSRGWASCQYARRISSRRGDSIT